MVSFMGGRKLGEDCSAPLFIQTDDGETFWDFCLLWDEEIKDALHRDTLMCYVVYCEEQTK